MAKYEHHFLPLSDAPRSETECNAIEVLGTIEFRTKSAHTLVIRLLGTPTGVAVIAVTTSKDAASHPDKSKWFAQIMEGMMTAIRLTYDSSAEPFFTGNGFINIAYESDEPEPKYQIVAGQRVNRDFRIPTSEVLGVFAELNGQVKTDVAALLAEAQVPSLPPHYAVLSLVRAIELLWPDHKERNAIYDDRQAEFAALEIGKREFRNALPELRNRCAHGVGRGDQRPYVGLGYNSRELRPLAKLLASIVARGLREQYRLQTIEP